MCQLHLACTHAVAVPSALTLSADHRKHFLSTLVMLITGQSVRAGTTDPSILHLILTMLRKWLLDTGSAHLSAKELLVIIQRIAQVRGEVWRGRKLGGLSWCHTQTLRSCAVQLDRMHAIPVGLKPVWDKDFLELLYDTITQKTAEQFGNEVFNRVERTFCCGLQSSDPAVRKKVGPLGAVLSRLPKTQLLCQGWGGPTTLPCHPTCSSSGCMLTECRQTCSTGCGTSSRSALQ